MTTGFRWTLAVATLAGVFGVATVAKGTQVLFGSAVARVDAGNYVPFVLWFNFLAGFAYLAAALGIALRRRWASRLAAAIAGATALVFLAALLSWIIFLTFNGETQTIHLLNWVQSGSFNAEWSIRLDRLTAIMLVVVNTVSALVHLYSFGYMAHDENWHEGEHYKARFFAYLSFFTFAMLMLVTADNLGQMFFGWEGVGVASYLLIGFYYKKPSANAAAIKGINEIAFAVLHHKPIRWLVPVFGGEAWLEANSHDIGRRVAEHVAAGRQSDAPGRRTWGASLD